MLTHRQRDILALMIRHSEQYGVIPSFDELCKAAGLKSKSGIHRLISGLEERGYISRLHNRARAIEIRLYPDGSPYSTAARLSFRHDRMDEMTEEAPHTGDNETEIPLLGKIAAGTPIAAIQNPDDLVAVPPHMLGAGEHFALTVEGDSMIDAGILDGDVVIIERADTAQNGDIVVALIDQEEATLKRLRRKSHSIALEPANARYETRIFGPDQVNIQGRLKGLLRRY